MVDRRPPADGPSPDDPSFDWVGALSGGGPRQREATVRLHALLVRAARFEIARRRPALSARQPIDFEDLATQVADDALMAVMRKLPTFRGDSRFTTWAYKFALLEAGVRLRRRTWADRELPLERHGWEELADHRAAPDVDLETAELLTAVGRTIATALTPHQRTVLIALALNEVPIDVLAERLDTTRGALYKTLHDARRKLRAILASEGHVLPGAVREGACHG